MTVLEWVESYGNRGLIYVGVLSCHDVPFFMAERINLYDFIFDGDWQLGVGEVFDEGMYIADNYAGNKVLTFIPNELLKFTC